jgi:hypothetical protein
MSSLVFRGSNYESLFTILWPGVELFVNTSQPFLVNVRVNLGRGYIHMPEHFLDASQIGSTGQQMRCEAMSQGMNS